MLVEIVNEIRVAEAYSYLQSEESGAINVFTGMVRNHSKSKAVLKLVFEAYNEMALAEMNKIATLAMDKWPIKKLIIQHVTGEKMVGENVVLIGVASSHRNVAFEACRYLIDELKKTVPIWKKEYYADHSTWVNAYP